MGNEALSQDEKLEALVRRAIENGWVPDRYDRTERQSSELDYEFVAIWYDFRSYSENYKLFIFNHDFARALFEEGKVTTENEFGIGKGKNIKLLKNILAWQYHLQMAVISNDPVNYLYHAVFDV